MVRSQLFLRRSQKQKQELQEFPYWRQQGSRYWRRQGNKTRSWSFRACSGMGDYAARGSVQLQQGLQQRWSWPAGHVLCQWLPQFGHGCCSGQCRELAYGTPEGLQALTSGHGSQASKDWTLHRQCRRWLPQRLCDQCRLQSLVIKHELFVMVGVAEGTRTASGGYTKAYYGHTDPGDGNYNRGTVSGGRGSSMSPADG